MVPVMKQQGWEKQGTQQHYVRNVGLNWPDGRGPSNAEPWVQRWRWQVFVVSRVTHPTHPKKPRPCILRPFPPSPFVVKPTL